MHPFVQMLSSLFEASAGLSEESLQHMVQALITISGESLQLAYNNREPSLFAIAKLLETGQVGFFSIVLQLAYNREPSLFAIAKLLETGQVRFFSLVLQLAQNITGSPASSPSPSSLRQDRVDFSL
jgi:phosphoribosyl-AMP cyclohydrolase